MLKAGEKLTFTTVPARSEIKISAVINGKPASASDILYGATGIALNKTMGVTPEERDYYRGLPDKFMNDGSPVILFGTFKKDKASAEDLKNAPKQLKSMLEQWGYIN